MTPTVATADLPPKDFTANVVNLIKDRYRPEVSGRPDLAMAQFPTFTGCAACGGITGYMAAGKVVTDRTTGYLMALIQWGHAMGLAEGQERGRPVAKAGSLPHPCTCTCDHDWTIERIDMHLADWTCRKCGDARRVDSSD